jgi:carbamoyl-phosphate synthase large subunit
MSIGATFEEAIMKAVRGAEISLESLSDKKLADVTTDEIRKRLCDCNDVRLFIIYEALKRGIEVEYINSVTR